MKDLLLKIHELESRMKKLEEENGKKDFAEKPLCIEPDKMPMGKIAYVGRYQSEDGSFGSTFSSNGYSIESIFSYNSVEMSKILSSLASEERINIIKELIKKRYSARELMEVLNFSTTGKLYHHLSFLEKIGIISKKNEKYYINTRYIGCLVLIFSGLAKILEKN